MARLIGVLSALFFLSCHPVARPPQERASSEEEVSPEEKVSPEESAVPATVTQGEEGSPSATQGEEGSPSATQGQEGSPSASRELRRAGVCARCHVISVLEWGVSEHMNRRTNCQKCHGPSEAHVANERNEVSPDYLPRGEEIAELCLDCHDEGCPETLDVKSCQNCHHPHALVHPQKPAAGEENRLNDLYERWRSFREKMQEGDALLELQKWEEARTAFRAAEELVPGDQDAHARLRVCERRLDPGLPGFEIVGADFDPATGLPLKVRVPEIGMTMLLVTPGKFDMGADHLKDSRPVHAVKVKPYYLGEFEVTQAQWRELMGADPSTHKDDAESGLPVETVSWEDCQAAVQKLNERVTGGGFRLPTEAEWEYACRAGSEPLASAEALGEFAWFEQNTELPAEDGRPFKDFQFFSSRPVGTKKSNPWGFHDMQGNVSEWCSSVWRPYPFDPSGDGEDENDTPMRLLRGGNFGDVADLLHPSLRHSERPHRRYRWNGLRLARTVTED